MKIAEEKVVSLTYDLNVPNEDGTMELMEQATVEQPLTFMFGMGMMLPDFEKHLDGLKTGDKFSFSLEPEQAYGLYDEDNVVDLPKSIFEVDGKFDSEVIKEDATVPMMTENGQRLMGSVLEIKEDVVVMDFNHPLAGETLHFSGEVIDVHEATAEEIAALTQPGGCSCGDCEGGDKNEQCGCGCNC
ncbi:peptidylprolyl isomerase [Bacteroidales bacterium OttesenSCG-928-J19]|nr:peptidylprolyl isomerase [Bacteroidales bacterium OttesenSCG-928-J19]